MPVYERDNRITIGQRVFNKQATDPASRAKDNNTFVGFHIFIIRKTADKSSHADIHDANRYSDTYVKKSTHPVSTKRPRYAVWATKIIIAIIGITLSVALHELFHIVVHWNDGPHVKLLSSQETLAEIIVWIPNGYDLEGEEIAAYTITLLTLIATAMIIYKIDDANDTRSAGEILFPDDKDMQKLSPDQMLDLVDRVDFAEIHKTAEHIPDPTAVTATAALQPTVSTQHHDTPESNPIQHYNKSLAPNDMLIANLLAQEIEKGLPQATSKIWYGAPVWFLNNNPIVGYSRRKAGMYLLFWSGQSFNERKLKKEGSFKAAQILYTDVSQIDPYDIARWLEKSARIQWDYEHIRKQKGHLKRRKKS